MNKHLLLTLLFIPLIAGCTANASSASQSNATLKWVYPFTDPTNIKCGGIPNDYATLELLVPLEFGSGGVVGVEGQASGRNCSQWSNKPSCIHVLLYDRDCDELLEDSELLGSYRLLIVN